MILPTLSIGLELLWHLTEVRVCVCVCVCVPAPQAMKNHLHEMKGE